MKNTKFKALVLVSALFAAPAFANPDLATIAGATDFLTAHDDVAVIIGVAADEYAAGTTSDTYNYGFISQAGTLNFAIINQDNATDVGNFAVIVQDATTNPGMAVISQTGLENFAGVFQRE